MTDILKYQECLKEAGKRKARADLSNVGKFDGVVLLHQPADLEIIPADILGRFPTETAVSHFAEAMALYIESYDPALAMRCLSTLQSFAVQIPENAYVQETLSRISPRVKSSYSSYERHIDRLPLNKPYKDSPLENLSIRQIDKALETFPGMWNLWWIRHCYCFRNNQMSDAGIAIQNANLLSPSNEQLSASLMLFISHVEPRALSTIELCRTQLKKFINSALINSTFAIAVLHAQRGQIRKFLLREAVEPLFRARELGPTDSDEAISMVASLFSYGQNSEQMTTTEKANALLNLVDIKRNIVMIDDLEVNTSVDAIDPIISSNPEPLMAWMFNKHQRDLNCSFRPNP